VKILLKHGMNNQRATALVQEMRFTRCKMQNQLQNANA
jgi:hypothetical protein